MVYFYLKRGPYGWLSNFSPHGIEMKGYFWPTVEHYYQAQKFAGTDYEDQIRQAPNPSSAKALAHARGHLRRADWNAIKYDTMHQAVLRKFETHTDLCQALLATGSEPLIENAPDDFYWGCGADGTGQNNLGKILMEVRSILRGRG
jgi:ribA/ribD-fused uncharacterized protein